MDDNNIKSYIFEYDITDHYPIAISFKIDTNKERK